jgi:hypothetical protein
MKIHEIRAIELNDLKSKKYSKAVDFLAASKRTISELGDGEGIFMTVNAIKYFADEKKLPLYIGEDKEKIQQLSKSIQEVVNYLIKNNVNYVILHNSY